MKTLVRALDLPIALAVTDEKAGERSFQKYFFTHTTDVSLERAAREKQFMDNGSFLLHRFVLSIQALS